MPNTLGVVDELGGRMSDNFITDSEFLYRRILADDQRCYMINDDGTIKVTSQAFSDREFKTSVDRAKLCNNDPKYTLGTKLGMVVSLVAGEIRKIDDVRRNDPRGRTIQQFKIDVEPVPSRRNVAHAEIHAIPQFDRTDRKAFNRLCMYLARLAIIDYVKLPAAQRVS